MSGSDNYTNSAPGLGFDQAWIDDQLKNGSGRDLLAAQILSQKSYDKWSGEGAGSVLENARLMASRLSESGIKRLEDFGQKQVPVTENLFWTAEPEYRTEYVYDSNDWESGGYQRAVNIPTGNYTWNAYRNTITGYGENSYSTTQKVSATPEILAKLGDPRAKLGESVSLETPTGEYRQEYVNKATGQVIPAQYDRAGGNIWGGTFAGDGSTSYGVSFNEMGMPVFYTQYGGSTSNWGAVSSVLSMASMIPGPWTPFVMAANAIGNAYNGNYVGAALNALGAANAYGTEFLNTSVLDAGVPFDQASAALDTASGTLAQNLAGIQTAAQAVGVLNAIDNRNLAGVIGGLVNIAPQVGITIPSDYIKPINVAATASAISKGDWAGALNSASLLMDNPTMRQDIKLAAQSARVISALKSGDPSAIFSSAVGFAQANNLGASAIKQAAQQTGMPISDEKANQLANSNSEVLSPRAYKAANSDLAGLNDEQALDHYINYGAAEGRDLISWENIAESKDPDFNPEAYAAAYQDLNDWIGHDPEQLAEHYAVYGQNEGRINSWEEFAQAKDPDFNPEAYAASYGDLAAAFGGDQEALAKHYALYGENEGRGAFNSWEEIAKSKNPGFDAEAYATKYSDLADAFGNDAQALAKHFATAGLSEGRDPTVAAPATPPSVVDDLQNAGLTENPDLTRSEADQLRADLGLPPEVKPGPGVDTAAFPLLALPTLTQAAGAVGSAAVNAGIAWLLNLGANRDTPAPSEDARKAAITMVQFLQANPNASAAEVKAIAPDLTDSDVENLKANLDGIFDLGSILVSSPRMTPEEKAEFDRLNPYEVQPEDYTDTTEEVQDWQNVTPPVEPPFTPPFELPVEPPKPITPPVEPSVTPPVAPPVTTPVTLPAEPTPPAAVEPAPAPTQPTPAEPTPTPVQPPAPVTPPTAGVTPAEVQKIVEDALKANPNLTAADVQKIVSDAVSVIPNLTADQVKQIVGDELTKLPTAATPQDVQSAVSNVQASVADTRKSLEDAIKAAQDAGLQGDAALKSAIDAVAASQQTSAADLLSKLGTTEAGLKSEFASGLAGVSAEVADTRKSLEDAIKAAQDIGLQGDAALQAAINSVAADQKISSTELLNQLGTTEAALRNDMQAGLAGVTANVADTKLALEQAIAAAQAAGMSGDQALQSAINKVAADQQTSAADLLSKLGATEAGLKTEFAAGLSGVSADVAATRTALENAIKAAQDIGLQGDAALRAGIDSVAAQLGTTSEALLSQLGTTEAGLRQEFASGLAGVQTQMEQQYNALTAAQKAEADARIAQGQTLEQAIAAAQAATTGQIAGLEAQTRAQYESLTASQKAAADALVAQGQTLQYAITAAKTEAAGQIAGVETRLTDAIAAAEAMGLSRDQAITAAVDAVASDLGTTRAALLAQLGTTEAGLRQEFASGISGLEAQTKAQYDSLSAAQKATADALVAQGQSMQQAITAAQQQTTSQIAGVESRLTDAIAAAEAMGLDRDQAITAAVDSVAAELGTTRNNLLAQLGTTEAALRTEFGAGLAGVSAEVKAAYDSLSAEQKALANQLAQQGTDMASAIQQAQQQTQGQIGALSADMQAKYDALTAEQKALANDMAQQGMDLTAAINLAQQQTQAQITGLGQQVDARINELMQQGQTYQQATQQAIGELSQQNQQLQGLVGTQGRQATQADIDALSQMLGGQKQVDLAYDVTGDKQITQADIDFLNQVVGGVKTDWTAPVGSAFGPTGLYGQLATNEAQRKADLQAQLAREQAAEEARAAQAAQAATAAKEAQRQATIRTTLGQGQQQLQQIAKQIPQALQQAQTTTTPIYGEMGPYLDIGSPLDFDFFKPSPEKQAATNRQQPTKIAAGGYIDDLLAEGMSVDDLLNLLR